MHDDHSTEPLLLLVVGAQPFAERHDRPAADDLRDRIVEQQLELDIDEPLEALVCTDLWYLNDSSLLAQPVISIGRAEVNAATAFLASRVPTAMVIDHKLRIHVDPSFVELRACVWGVDPDATADAVDLFAARHLGPFLRAAHDLPAGTV